MLIRNILGAILEKLMEKVLLAINESMMKSSLVFFSFLIMFAIYMHSLHVPIPITSLPLMLIIFAGGSVSAGVLWSYITDSGRLSK